MAESNRKTVGIILGIAIIIVIALLSFNYSTQKRVEPGDIVFPEEIQGLKLSEVISGPRAIAMISKLHGTDIAINQGYIANYGNDSSRIMIWVSESANKKEADQLFIVMDRKISAAASSKGAPFTDRRVFVRNSKRVIAVKGMGMENYYYKSGEKVYWIAVGGIDPIGALDDIIENLP